MKNLSSFFGLLGANLVFVALFGVIVALLASRRKPAYAVLKRNFLAYFTSPIGYVFLCLFVWLTTVAAFWAEDFFNSNLANLDQLNHYLPLILLVFIPAITMSIWAEERRQGTDELLLTIPATDFDIVLGKYLAAVAIFTVSLIFSEICNFLVLCSLGSPDTGLFLGNYFGYWLAGIAMLAIGMVGSFLTYNLTVGFVLGVLLNVPLVAAGYADVVFGARVGRALSRWSISEQFADFQGGVISLSSVLFFLMVAAVMFYISMVLIGRRHWRGGRDGRPMGFHYLTRSVALIVLVGAACVLLSRWDVVRADVTNERLNSMHPDTLKLIASLNPSHPIHVDAYISHDLPEEYVRKKIDLANVLRELQAQGRGKIETTLHEIDPFGEEAVRAKSVYGIEARDVVTEIRGAETTQKVIFGFGVRCGLERVSIPFMGQGTRVEYELIRAIVTVADANKVAEETDKKGKGAKKDASARKRIGVLTTDAHLMGAPAPPGARRNEQPIIEELRRQYQVVSVDPNQEIAEDYDVLLAVQPSALNATQLKNFVAAVKRGIPTAIFEDPFPAMIAVPGTTAPKRPPMGLPFMMQPPEPKADMQPLWDLLGWKIGTVKSLPEEGFEDDPDFGAIPKLEAEVVWQNYNPHEADRDRLPMRREWVFITPTAKSGQGLSERTPSVSGLQEVLLLYPGVLKRAGATENEYTTLIETTHPGGTIEWKKLVIQDLDQSYLAPREKLAQDEKPSAEALIMAVHIRGPAADEESAPDEKEAQTGEPEKKRDKPLNVVLVADIDVLSGVFFDLWAMGNDPRNPIRKWNLDNVPLVLNIIDELAEEPRFLNIRKHRPKHRELTTISGLTRQASEIRREVSEASEKSMEKTINEEMSQMRAMLKKEQAQLKNASTGVEQRVRIKIEDAQKRLDRKKAELDKLREENFREIDRELAGQIQKVQDNYKMWAVILPPIPPLLIALCVFFVRRSREREGVAADRWL